MNKLHNVVNRLFEQKALDSGFKEPQLKWKDGVYTDLIMQAMWDYFSTGYYAAHPALDTDTTPFLEKSEDTIEDTTEAWENGTLGCDARFARVVEQSEQEIQAINDAFDLEVIELRLEKEVVEEFKRIAATKGVGYKTLMRVSLKTLAATGNSTF